MSAQPWQRVGATVYQLTDDGTQNLWSANVKGPASSRDDGCKTAQKMAAAPDMYEALPECICGLEVGLDAAQIVSTLGDGRCAAIRSALTQARAALAKAGGQ